MNRLFAFAGFTGALRSVTRHARQRGSSIWLISALLALTSSAAPVPPGPQNLKDLRAAEKASQENKLDEAERIFSDIALRDPTEIRARLGLADVTYRAGKISEAERIIRQAVADFPKEAGVQVSLGRFLYAQKRFKEAEAALLAARDLDNAAYINVDLGTLYAEALDRPADALDCFYRAVARSPELPGAHYALGQVLSSQGQWDIARAEFETAVKLDPKSALAWLGLGRAQIKLGRAYAAVPAYDKAVQLAPKSAIIAIERGDLNSALGKDADALRDYQNALRLDEKSFLGWAKLGMFQQSRHRLPEADAAYVKALAVDPQSALVLNNRAALALDGYGKLTDAIAWSKQAVASDPKNPYYLDTLGALLEKTGQLEEAQHALETARQVAPDYLGARYHLASVLSHRGKTTEARALLEESLKDNATFPERPAFEKLLAELNAPAAK